MGQVWSKADFDGMTELGTHGGCGSVLAVTSQHLGTDGQLGTEDDLLAPANAQPGWTSVDAAAGPNCRDNGDRVRNFFSFHADGAFFVFGDGSVHFVSETIDPATYQALSTIAGEEVAALDD